MKKSSKKSTPAKKVECYEFYVDGMHCAACELTVERNLKKFKGVKSVDAKLDDGIVKIEGVFNESEAELAKDLTKLVKKDGYKILTEKIVLKKDRKILKDTVIAFCISLPLIAGYLLLQETPFIQTNFNNIDFLAIFLIGVIASLSSCAAVVGGLVLSISANYSKNGEGSKIIPQITFHAGRLVSFFLLGGVLGLIGALVPIQFVVSALLALLAGSMIYTKFFKKTLSSMMLAIVGTIVSTAIIFFALNFSLELASKLTNFDLNIISKFALSLLVVIVMILLGLNLLEIFGFTKRFQLRMPKSLSHSILRAENIDNWVGPIVLGAITFFLPCGVTQSVQVFALETNNVLQGALIMFFFALGTLPVLGLISFASMNVAENVRNSSLFFKTAGFLVIGFALYNLIQAMATVGLLVPINL